MSHLSFLFRLAVVLRSACRSSEFYTRIFYAAYGRCCEAAEKQLGTSLTDDQRNELRAALAVSSIYKVESGPEDFCRSAPPLIQHTGTTVIAHEFAHASSTFDSRLSEKQRDVLQQAREWGTWLFPYICAMLATSRSYSQNTGRSLLPLERGLKGLIAVSTATQLPRLAEELQASIRGCMTIGKVMGAKEALKSAVLFSVCFGSYLLPLAEGAAMPAIFEKEAAAQKAVLRGLKSLFRRKP